MSFNEFIHMRIADIILILFEEVQNMNVQIVSSFFGALLPGMVAIWLYRKKETNEKRRLLFSLKTELLLYGDELNSLANNFSECEITCKRSFSFIETRYYRTFVYECCSKDIGAFGNDEICSKIIKCYFKIFECLNILEEAKCTAYSIRHVKYFTPQEELDHYCDWHWRTLRRFITNVSRVQVEIKQTVDEIDQYISKF